MGDANDPKMVRRMLELEQQQRQADAVAAFMAGTPLPITPQTVSRFSLTVCGPRLILVTARAGAVMADGHFDPNALAVLSALDFDRETVEQLHSHLTKVLDHFKTQLLPEPAAPGETIQ